MFGVMRIVVLFLSSGNQPHSCVQVIYTVEHLAGPKFSGAEAVAVHMAMALSWSATVRWTADDRGSQSVNPADINDLLLWYHQETAVYLRIYVKVFHNILSRCWSLRINCAEAKHLQMAFPSSTYYTVVLISICFHANTLNYDGKHCTWLA